MNQPLDAKSTNNIKLDSYRYINLALFILAALFNSFPGQAFNTIGPHTQEVYNVSTFVVTLNALFPPFVNVVLLFPTTYILQKYGLKVGTLICELLMLVGLAVRLLINVNFYFFLLGTFITTLGFTFMIASANKFATIWFPQPHIPIVSTACLFAVFASPSIGSFSTALFLDESSNKEDYFNYFFWLGIIIAIVQLLMIILFREKPKNPQNFVSIAKRTDPKKAIIDLFKNKNYLFLFISMTFVYAMIGVLFVTFSWQLKIYNFNSSVAGFFIIIANVAGFVGCGVFGFILERTRWHKKISVICVFSAAIAILFTIIALQLEWLWLLYTSAAALGFFAFAFLTTMGDFAAEVAFPIAQSAATGLLTIGGQIMAIPCSLLLNMLFQNLWNTRIGNGIQFLLFLTGAIIMLFSRQQLNRTNYQNAKQKQFCEDGQARTSIIEQQQTLESH